MLLRDAQEQARVIYNARQNSLDKNENLLRMHLSEVISILEKIRMSDVLKEKDIVENLNRTVGLMLLVSLELANQLEVDSLDALKSVLLEESP